MATALEGVILGYADEGQQVKLLACSGGAPSRDPAYYRQRIPLEPMPVSGAQASQAMAMLAYDESRALLARAYFQGSQQTAPTYQYILVPYTAQLAPILNLFRQPIALKPADFALEPPAKHPDDRAAQLKQLIGQMPDGHFDFALTLLGAVVHERGLLIPNFPLDFPQRAALIQGIHALLPATAAMRLTFSSSSIQSSAAEPQLVFADESNETARWIYDWAAPRIIEELLEHPYIQLLRSLWQGDIPALAAAMEDLDGLNLRFDDDGSLSSYLISLTERFSLNSQVKAGHPVETSPMMQALASDAPPQGRLRYQYIKKLLENALNHRDSVAGLWVAEELERDAELEPALDGLFDDMLETQPDTVYVFIRNRLNHLGLDEKWIPRLQLAAAHSLEVAIQDSDTSTLVSWLKLAAREPQAYQLLDALRQGILSAQTRAHNDGELGLQLILIATRRLPELVEALYQDARLIHALALHAQQTLQTAKAQSLQDLAAESPEYFLLALFYGIQISESALVKAAAIKSLWRLHQAEAGESLPAAHRPAALIHHLATQASHQMTDPALDALLHRIITSGDSDLFIAAAKHLAERDALFPRLGAVLEADSFTLDTILSIMNVVTGLKDVSPQETLDTYFILLDYYEWAPETQPMMEALARHMGSHPALNVSYRHLWKLCETCNALQIETATRAAIQQLFQQFDDEEDAQLVVAGIARISKQISWSRTLLTALNDWWRGYANARAFAQLQRLERGLDAQRHLETQKQILKTALAMRRLMHDRGPAEFAEAINTACAIIENIADAFDADPPTEIDSRTIRRELDKMSPKLSTDEQHVLANNLRNLAHLITVMANNRSKPSLIRRDDSIDRHLMLGEASPHGSIDMMKWIAGYLGGAHSETGS